MENLSTIWESFSLSESEGSKYLVTDNGLDGKYPLAARFFTGRVLSMEAIARTFKLLWHTKKGLNVRDMTTESCLSLYRILMLTRFWWVSHGPLIKI